MGIGRHAIEIIAICNFREDCFSSLSLLLSFPYIGDPKGAIPIIEINDKGGQYLHHFLDDIASNWPILCSPLDSFLGYLDRRR